MKKSILAALFITFSSTVLWAFPATFLDYCKTLPADMNAQIGLGVVKTIGLQSNISVSPASVILPLDQAGNVTGVDLNNYFTQGNNKKLYFRNVVDFSFPVKKFTPGGTVDFNLFTKAMLDEAKNTDNCDKVDENFRKNFAGQGDGKAKPVTKFFSFSTGSIAHPLSNIEIIPLLKNYFSEIYLSHNNITDLRPLAQLAGSPIRALFLAKNKLKDIGPLAGLSSLEKLDLSSNDLVDISPLANLRNLRELDLFSNRTIVDIRPLSGLSQLFHLALSDNRVDNLEPIRNLRQLNYFSASCNLVKNLEPLGDKMAMSNIILDRNCISDVGPLSNMKGLKMLKLKFNSIKNFKPVDIYKDNGGRIVLGADSQNFCRSPDEKSCKTER